MPHFFVPPEKINDGRFTLSGEEAHHLLHVRRCAAGMIICIFDGTGKSYRAEITAVSKSGLSGTILSTEEAVVSRVHLQLFQSVPKGDRFDWLVEKAAELGVAVITPLVTERSVLREISPQKLERWRRLSTAASQQSARGDRMEITEPLSLQQAIEKVPASALNIIPWESEDTATIDQLSVNNNSFAAANIFIGPEGGFAPREIEAAGEKGIVPVTLGPRILRAETAGILAAILVLALRGEYGK